MEKGLMEKGFSIVCVSRQDWHAGLPTNRQQIMVRAAKRGHRVLFVETGGHLSRHLWRLVTRPGRGSLARRLFGAERPAEGIAIEKALTIAPWGQKFRLPNLINSRLTGLRIRRAARRLDGQRVLWLYDPTAFELVGHVGEDLTVYDVVDDYAEQVGPDARRRRFVAEADEEAASRSQVVFATTSGLYERQLARNPDTHLVRNGADYAHFSNLNGTAPEVRALPEPIVGFAGNLTPEKVDFGLLGAVARSRPDWSVVLVGPAAEDARSGLEPLAQLPNVHVLGFQPYDDLPSLVGGFSVGLIPYRATAYTRNCSPLKVFEYLAAGKAVVASGVSELAGMEPDVVLVEGADGFVAAIEAALADDSSDAIARRQRLAEKNTWEGRTERLLELIGGKLGG
jgi:glycosyltransferase involved in cell wall biosynthesis